MIGWVQALSLALALIVLFICVTYLLTIWMSQRQERRLKQMEQQHDMLKHADEEMLTETDD